MNDIERKAVQHFKRSEWAEALDCFEKLLTIQQNGVKNNISEEKVLTLLIGKSECNLALGRTDNVVQDCRRILHLLSSEINSYQKDRIRKLLLKSLLISERFTEVESTVSDWLIKGNIQPETRFDLEELLKKLKANGHCKSKKMDDDFNALDTCFNKMSVHGKQEVLRINDASHEVNRSHSIKLAGNVLRDEFVCSYCAVRFFDAAGLRTHCQTNSHQMIIMSDEGRDWRYRPPPRGLTAEAYSLCENYLEKEGICRYGERCVDAHGDEELAEWTERLEYRRMRMQRASEKQLYGKSYTEQLLERWANAPYPEDVMREKIEGVEQSISGDLVTTVSSKNSQREWTFLLKTALQLKAVALLQDAHRNHFSIRQVSTGDPATVMSGGGWKPSNDQEWTSSTLGVETKPVWSSGEEPLILEHRVRVGFKTEIYGTFRQSVVFDFGLEPFLVKHLCVDVVPVTDVDKLKEIQKEVVVSAVERWCEENAEIIPFTSIFLPAVGLSVLDGEKERHLLEKYPTPRPGSFTLTHSTLLEKAVTKNNYRDRMHELLFVEEMARYDQVARYNVSLKLQIVNCYFLTPNGLANSTAKYAQNGELFALMSLGKVVSEDTSAGRLILNNCSTVFLSFSSTAEGQRRENGKLLVHEAVIEDKGKSTIYLRLSADTVAARGLRPDTSVPCQIQFQLNRIPYCEWHYAIDRIVDYRLIFPDTILEPSIPWSPHRHWSDVVDTKLNSKQREAVVAITSPVAMPLPPILIIGPFGTGKTYTLAQAIKHLMTQPDTRVLVCTHSNSAADLYIKDYLHPYVEAGHEEARPLRIYYHKRWVATVNAVVQKYSLIEMVNGTRAFKRPCLEDIMKHRIVVVTLSISMYLSSLGLKKGHFTHILLDEAAQAMECEAIMPLALANENTRIVLAGDHMQLSPELFSQFAKERNLHVSLLERLYDHYPCSFPCKILLCENYRAHEAIINFTSELFYDQKLVSSGKQPRHDKFYPLTFFTTRGEDVQDINSTAFYNNSEVYEVVERVCELRKKWPSAWGKLEDQSIGIMTPYADQVYRIRSELRKRRLGCISVERVLNVQGKQFRAIFLSTVRTRRTCRSPKDKSAVELDFGFLSNWKLLNTAITRAQSLVAVVGDPVALCSIGRCRKVWERFLEICNDNKSLYGITWSLLRSQLDGVELKKDFTLNPLAPEFIPRAIQSEAYIKLPPMIPGVNPGIRPLLPPPMGFPLLLCPPPPNFAAPLIPQPPILPFHIGAPNPWPQYPAIKKEETKPFLPEQRSPGMLDMNLVPSFDGIDNAQGILLHPHPPPSICLHGGLPDTRVPPQMALMRGGGIEKADCIQFLSNVHFPERAPPPPPHPTPDWLALLPPNTSLSDILASQALQMDWYLHLATTVSLDIAEKFKDLIIRANETPISPSSDGQMGLNRIEQMTDMDRGPKPVLLTDVEATIMPHPHVPTTTIHQISGPPLGLPPPPLPLFRRQPAKDPYPSTPYQEQGAVVANTSTTSLYMNDFHLNGREQDIDEPASSRHNVETTYASVVRAQPSRSPHSDDARHSLGILRAFSRSSSLRGNNGLYQYFS